ncbi:hypothetical protein ACFDR9_005495, partial [Janthinobacterium sp. CG_23.3]
MKAIGIDFGQRGGGVAEPVRPPLGALDSPYPLLFWEDLWGCVGPHR